MEHQSFRTWRNIYWRSNGIRVLDVRLRGLLLTSSHDLGWYSVRSLDWYSSKWPSVFPTAPCKVDLQSWTCLFWFLHQIVYLTLLAVPFQQFRHLSKFARQIHPSWIAVTARHFRLVGPCSSWATDSRYSQLCLKNKNITIIFSYQIDMTWRQFNQQVSKYETYQHSARQQNLPAHGSRFWRTCCDWNEQKTISQWKICL